MKVKGICHVGSLKHIVLEGGSELCYATMGLIMNKEFDCDYALNVAIESVKKAGEILKGFQGSHLKVWRKTGFDIVSEADISAQKEIIQHLKKYFPDHLFLSEELEVPSEATRRFRWIVDPLDGTINYVSGLPLFSISVALQDEGKTILGVIFDPVTDELYTSIRGRGSFANGKKIEVSDTPDLGESVLAFMLTSHYTKELVNEVIGHINKLAMSCRGLRLYVSQALELAYTASGRLDGTFCVKSRGFSAAAGALVVREAGGRVTDLSGREFDNHSRSLLATNALLHDRIVHILSEV